MLKCKKMEILTNDGKVKIQYSPFGQSHVGASLPFDGSYILSSEQAKQLKTDDMETGSCSYRHNLLQRWTELRKIQVLNVKTVLVEQQHTGKLVKNCIMIKQYQNDGKTNNLNKDELKDDESSLNNKKYST